MKIRTKFYTNLALIALAACLPLGTAAWANSIPGTSLTPTVWWSADAANNVINNGAVTQLTDQSGNGNNAVQDTQNETPLPLFVTNAINGLPTLGFGGTNCLISATGATTGNSSHSIFIVASYTALAQYRNGAVFYSDTAGADQNSCLGVNPNGNTMWVGGYAEDNAPYVGSIPLDGAGFNILGKIYTASSANYQGFVAGVQDVNATGDTYNLGDTRVGLGKQYNNGSYWAGDIAEVIVFNSALSYSDLEAVQHYLANKYNLPLALPGISLTAANTTLFGGSNAVLTLTIPQAANASQAVTVTVTNNNPGVVSLQGAVGNILTVTFPAGATNVQSVTVTGVNAGQASLTYASPGLVPTGPATINVVFGVSVIPVTGGDLGQGFSPLPIDVAAVDFDSRNPNQTIQGVSFTADVPTPEGGLNTNPGGGFGGYNGYTAPTFSPADANNTAMSAVFSGFYYANNNLQQSTIGGNEYGQYQFTGLSVGQTYQVDLFTIADSNPRYTLTQVIGATTNSYDVLTELTPTIVSYTAMTPDANGDITVQFCWGPGSVAGSSGNSGLISAIALTTRPSSTSMLLTPANTSLFGGSNTVLTLTIPSSANASRAVTVTVTNNNPGVVSLQGAVGNILTVTFPAGATNVQSVVVTGVGAGQASLTYASPGLVPTGPATINVVIPSSMIGHWLSGTQSFADTSGYKAPGTHDGVPTGANYYWTNDVPASRSGYSLAFPASNPDTVILITNTWDTLSTDPGYQPTFDGDIVNAFSVALWAKGFPATWNPWMSKWGENYTGPNAGWQLRQFSSTGNSCFTVRGAATAGDLEASTNSNDGNWHYYVGTYDAQHGLQSIYVDGTLSAQAAVSSPSGAASYEPMIICGKSNGDGTPTSMATYGEEITSAEVYDIRIYNYALGPSQVSQLYSGTASAPTLGVTRSGSNLVLTWQAGSTLLQATNLLGPWTTNLSTSPYIVIPTGPQMFFRAQAP